MEIVQIIAIAFIATFIVMILKQYRPEFSIYISIIAGILIFFIVIAKLTSVIELIKSLSSKLGTNMQYFSLLIKITGIAYLSEFATNICKDSGETAIASKVELAGRIIIIAMSVPILGALIDTITNILP
ncbi:MAG: stage III sporulation protein AD [Clostridia bacterium]|nr:stage III sporulation protein AD [Clostridia bacterium]